MNVKLQRVASGDYETADGRFRVWQLPGVYPPAWNVEDTTFDPNTATARADALVVDGAATKRDAVGLLEEHIAGNVSNVTRGLRDAYIAAVKAPFLALPNSDENWASMLDAVEHARALLAQGAEAVALHCESQVALAATTEERERWLRLASRFWEITP